MSYVNNVGIIAIALGDNQEALDALGRVCDWKRERGAPDIAQHDALIAVAEAACDLLDVGISGFVPRTHVNEHVVQYIDALVASLRAAGINIANDLKDKP